MAKTEFMARSQPGGVFVFTDESKTTGNIFFVHSGTGTNGAGYGRNPDAPTATLDYAIGLCTASQGDRIYVMPGHAESLTGAAAVALDVAGVKVVGLGQGRNRPVFTYTTAVGASVDVSAANCAIENCVFVVGYDAITAMFNITGADFTFRGNEIVTATASYQATLGILTTAAATRLTVDNNYFHGTTDAGTATAIRIVGGDDHSITNNVILGAFTTTLGGIQNVTTACVNLKISGNTIANLTASASVAITLVSTTTGMVTNNRLSVLTGTAPVVGAALNGVGGNYYCAAAGVTAGTLL